jgi:hypothetical protein
VDSTERIINTFRGKDIDRLPTYDIIHNIDFIEYVTGQKIDHGNAEDVTCKAVRDTLDMVRHFVIPYDQRVRENKDEDGFIYRTEWWTKAVLFSPLKNMDDARQLMERDIKRIYDCILNGRVCPQVTKNYAQLLAEDCNSFEEVEDKFSRLSNKLGDTVMIAPESLTGAYIALARYGFNFFSYMMADDPDLLSQYLDALCDYEIARIRSFAPSGLTRVAFVSGIPSSNRGLIFSPDFMEKELYPRIKKVVSEWEKFGYYVLFFADGYKWPFIDEIISYGADSINPCEPKAGMDLKRFRQKYPDTVIGSMIDCQNLLAFASPKEIESATLKAINESGGSKTLIGSTSEIHPDIPVQNALAMYETVKKTKH